MRALSEPRLVEELLAQAGPCLPARGARVDLSEVYQLGWHWESRALIIASRGAVLYCLSPRYRRPYLLFHRGMSVIRAGLGAEMLNLGQVGDVYTQPIVARAESACSPSFLFGSQRCNCRHQWECVQELAAHANPVSTPPLADGPAFERWVQSQVKVQEGRVSFVQPGARGFLLLHMDSQNGMGSGYTAGQTVEDLTTRASMRHRGEYSCEQLFGASMAEAFTSLGLQPDPRGLEDGLGYQTPFIALDFLGVNRELSFLSNNPLKYAHPLARPYQIRRIGLAGEVNLAGAEEALSRHTEFGHHPMDTQVNFEQELTRLQRELEL